MEITADSASILAIAVGNTRVRWARFRGKEPSPGDAAPLEQASSALHASLAESVPDVMLIASVHHPDADALESSLAPVGPPVLRFGRDFVPPMQHTLDDASTLGQDRVCTAIGAFELVQSAVAVIDAGTAVTVDFVDGEGVFHGGVIAPGVQMMLDALHGHTSALPDLQFDPSMADPAGDGPFGRATAHAMQLGAGAAARGMVRDVVERFAEHYEAYPRVLATGGDAPALFESDDLVERIIPDLQLIGLQRAFAASLADESE